MTNFELFYFLIAPATVVGLALIAVVIFKRALPKDRQHPGE